MRVRELTDQRSRVLVIVCDQGEEAVRAVNEAIRQYRVGAAQVTGVGGFRAGELGYFDRTSRTYLPIPVDEQVEVLSLVGDVAQRDGTPELHAHVVCGRRDGSTVGGHLLRGEVFPTLEIIVTEVVPALARRFDADIGLALLDPGSAD
ncbi:DNA-binding protein [Micromonospora sonneratiae]|jgi:predicted DNA-binding protein with PD1-like motif|uniref:PPC domain-containing DNA-binding protein n=1 Tax=Micromonospora sonneratiae TaxID=1184706 RepID=A0ABW3Y510_9ACTN